MASTKFLSIAVLPFVASAFAAEKVSSITNPLSPPSKLLPSNTAKILIYSKATIYSQEPCKGETAEIEPNNKCTLVPENLYVKNEEPKF